MPHRNTSWVWPKNFNFNSWIFLELFLLISLCHFGTAQDAQMKEYCQSENFKATCPKNHVIMITAAIYGRIHLGTCLTEDFGYLGCTNDVLAELDHLCSGRQECEVLVDEKTFKSAAPCHKDLKSYLEASYKCIETVRPNFEACTLKEEVLLTQTEGYIPSLLTERTGCGSADSPWLLKVPAGQKVNITLFDFAINARNASNKNVCRVYATLREKAFGRSITVCGGQSRIRHVFTSTTNEVEIRVLNSNIPTNPMYFMIHYRAIGCPDPKISSNAWIQRDENIALVGCEGTKDSWKIVCNGNIWEGTLGNCTSKDEGSFQDLVLQVTTLPYDISIIIVVAIAFFIALLVLIVGIFCLRWRKARFQHQNENINTAMQEPDPRQQYYIQKTPDGTKYIAPGGSIACIADTGGAGNEYASMRLLTDCTYDETMRQMPARRDLSPTTHGTMGYGSHMTLPGGRYHIYESPESIREAQEREQCNFSLQHYDLEADTQNVHPDFRGYPQRQITQPAEAAITRNYSLHQ